MPDKRVIVGKGLLTDREVEVLDGSMAELWDANSNGNGNVQSGVLLTNGNIVTAASDNWLTLFDGSGNQLNAVGLSDTGKQTRRSGSGFIVNLGVNVTAELRRYNADLSFDWSYVEPNGYTHDYGFVVDSAGNSYLLVADSGTPTTRVLIKVSPTGTEIDRITLSIAGNHRDVAITTDDRIFLVDDTPADLVELNTSLVEQQRVPLTLDEQVSSIAVDTARGYVYTWQPGSDIIARHLIANLSEDGTLSTAATDDGGANLCVDSDGYIYGSNGLTSADGSAPRTTRWYGPDFSGKVTNSAAGLIVGVDVFDAIETGGSISAPTFNEKLTGATYTVQVSASADPGQTVSTVEVFHDSTSLGLASFNAGSGFWELSIPVEPRRWRLTATITDSAAKSVTTPIVPAFATATDDILVDRDGFNAGYSVYLSTAGSQAQLLPFRNAKANYRGTLVDYDGSVFVYSTSSVGTIIRKFDRNGHPVGQCTIPGELRTQYWDGNYFDAYGNLYLFEYDEFNGAPFLAKINADMTLAWVVDNTTEGGYFNYASGYTVTPEGEVWVAQSNFLTKINPDGSFALSADLTNPIEAVDYNPVTGDIVYIQDDGSPYTVGSFNRDLLSNSWTDATVTDFPKRGGIRCNPVTGQIHTIHSAAIWRYESDGTGVVDWWDPTPDQINTADFSDNQLLYVTTNDNTRTTVVLDTAAATVYETSRGSTGTGQRFDVRAAAQPDAAGAFGILRNPTHPTHLHPGAPTIPMEIATTFQVEAVPFGTASSVTSVEIFREGISQGTASFNAGTGYWELDVTPPAGTPGAYAYTIEITPDVGSVATEAHSITETLAAANGTYLWLATLAHVDGSDIVLMHEDFGVYASWTTPSYVYNASPVPNPDKRGLLALSGNFQNGNTWLYIYWADGTETQIPNNTGLTWEYNGAVQSNFDGSIVIVQEDASGDALVIDAATGTLLWQWATADWQGSFPRFGLDGRVYSFDPGTATTLLGKNATDGSTEVTQPSGGTSIAFVDHIRERFIVYDSAGDVVTIYGSAWQTLGTWSGITSVFSFGPDNEGNYITSGDYGNGWGFQRRAVADGSIVSETGSTGSIGADGVGFVTQAQEIFEADDDNNLYYDRFIKFMVDGDLGPTVTRTIVSDPFETSVDLGVGPWVHAFDVFNGVQATINSPAPGSVYTNDQIKFEVATTLGGTATTVTSATVYLNDSPIGEACYDPATGICTFYHVVTQTGSLTLRMDVTPDSGVAASVEVTLTGVTQGYPVAVETQSGFTGTLANVQADADAPDGTWVTQDNNGATPGVLRYSFLGIHRDLLTGAADQAFKAWVRKFGLAGDPDPLVTVSLYESGSLVRDLLTNVAVTSLTGELLSATWGVTELIDQSGAGAEIRIEATRQPNTIPGGTNRVAPNGVSNITNFNQTGGTALAAIDEDPDAPDGSWMTATGPDVTNTVLVAFDQPLSTLDAGASAQEFRLWVRSTTTNYGTIDVELWRNGALQTVLLSGVTLSSTTGQLITAQWDTADLGTTDGTSVECFIRGIGPGGGSPGGRGSLEVGAVEWMATTQGTTTYPAGMDVDAVEWETGWPDLPFRACGIATLGAITASGTSTFAEAGINATGSATLPALTASGTATSAVPVYTATATAVLPSLAVSATATMAAPTLTLVPNGDLGQTGMTTSGATFWETTDDGVDSADGDTGYIENVPPGNADVTFDLTDPPAGFETMLSVKIRLRGRKV